jgi:hypothetical protein
VKNYSWIKFPLPTGITKFERAADEARRAVAGVRRALESASHSAQIALEPDLARLRAVLVAVRPDALDFEAVLEACREVRARIADNRTLGGAS